MSRWGLTAVLMLGLPFVFVSEVQSLCALLDFQLDACGKALTLFGAGMTAVSVLIARHE